MKFDAEFAKKHWPLLGIALVAVIVLYELVKHGRGAAASSGTVSAPDQVQALSAGASLQNAQVNGQVEIAQVQAGVADNQIAAALQAKEVETAAQLAATNRQTDASVAINEQNVGGAVSIAQIQADAAVKQTAIEGSTIQAVASTGAARDEAVAQTAASVELAQISDVNSQIATLMKYSRHFSQDIKAIAPALAVETGQGGAGASIAASNAQENIAKSPASIISSASSGIASIMSGLFK